MAASSANGWPSKSTNCWWWSSTAARCDSCGRRGPWRPACTTPLAPAPVGFFYGCNAASTEHLSLGRNRSKDPRKVFTAGVAKLASNHQCADQRARARETRAREREANEADRERQRAAGERKQTARRYRIQVRCLVAQCRFLLADSPPTDSN
jgi:hypothetical protein